MLDFTRNMIYANGCKRRLYFPELNQELLDLTNFITTEYLKENIYVDAMNKKHALRVGQIFLASNFKLHNLWQLDPSKILEESKDTGTITIGRLLELEKESEKYIHPFSLKVLFSNKYDIFEGELLARTYMKELGGITRAHPSFLKIHLSSKATIVTPSIYVHELTHSQLQSNLGSVRYYKNIELVCSYETDESEYTLKMIEKFLCNEITRFTKELMFHQNGLHKLTADQLIETGKYLSSIISALNFFLIYYNYNETTKKEILLEIQKIFDAKKDLEEVLNRFGINDELNNEKLIKHLTR